uniref:Crumbs homolog 3b n=1 Tax=Gadus morhua TaxID=8049 RepID=A0A8C5FSE7_GADMO
MLTCSLTVVLTSTGRMFPLTPSLWLPTATAASLLSLSLIVVMCVLRKKRRLEGTYRPSAEERKQVGAPGSERPGLPLPIPKEERLI